MDKNGSVVSVMLVDSHLTFLWGLEKLITANGPQLRVVGQISRSADVLEAAESTRADVVVMDLDFGGKFAIDLLCELAERRIKVIVLTGIRDPGLPERSCVCGARGFVGKWEAPEVIIKAIRAVHAGEMWIDRQTTTRVIDALARGASRKKSTMNPYDGLTVRELDVVAGVVKNKSMPNKVIADELHISPNTLRNHLAAVYTKLGIHRRVDLVMYVAERGLNREA